MSRKGIYYPGTTYSQRRALFEEWEAKQNVREACEAVRVSESTYYYWKARYEEAGNEGLKACKKPGPRKGMVLGEGLQRQVVELKQSHPAWGKQRIADEVNKGHQWVKVISPNSVRRILEEKGLWVQGEEAGKKTSRP